MNHEDSFKAWLPDNKVVGDSITSYISYLTSVENNLGNIDTQLESGIEIVLENINKVNFPENADSTLMKYRSAVQKYFDFLNFSKS